MRNDIPCGIMQDIFREIAGHLDRPSRASLRLACSETYAALSQTPRDKVSLLEECCRADHLNLYLEFTGGLTAVPASRIAEAAALRGATKMLEYAFEIGAEVTTDIVAATLASKSVGSLLIVFSNTRATLRDYTERVISSDALLWIPAEYLVGVHRRLSRMFIHAIVQACTSIKTLVYLERHRFLPSRKYIHEASLSAGVICDIILSGEETSLTPNQILSAVKTAIYRGVLDRLAGARVLAAYAAQRILDDSYFSRGLEIVSPEGPQTTAARIMTADGPHAVAEPRP